MTRRKRRLLRIRINRWSRENSLRDDLTLWLTVRGWRSMFWSAL